MAERDIVAAILRLLKKTPGCFAWKEHGGMYRTAGMRWPGKSTSLSQNPFPALREILWIP